MSHDAQLTDAARIRDFMFAGRARFTLVSMKTGARFTYRINASEDGRVYFVQLLRGSDNDRDFIYLGTYRGGQYRRGAKSHIGEDAPSAVAFAWFAQHLVRNRVPQQIEFWHEGRCGRCARPLTDPASIEAGFGPECITKVADPALAQAIMRPR